MSIQEHLNKIRNAIKGSEVRESIAKGIETAYDDASEKDNANMEVKIARGTHPNLRSRLEEVDNKQQQTTAQLAQTRSVKVGGGVKADLEDLSSDVLSAIEGGEGTEFNLLSEPQNFSVTPIKEADTIVPFTKDFSTHNRVSANKLFIDAKQNGLPKGVVNIIGKFPEGQVTFLLLEKNGNSFVVLDRVVKNVPEGTSTIFTNFITEGTGHEYIGTIGVINFGTSGGEGFYEGVASSNDLPIYNATFTGGGAEYDLSIYPTVSNFPLSKVRDELIEDIRESTDIARRVESAFVSPTIERDFSITTRQSRDNFFVPNEVLGTGNVIIHIISPEAQSSHFYILEKTQGNLFKVVAKKLVDLGIGYNVVDMEYTTTGRGNEFFGSDAGFYYGYDGGTGMYESSIISEYSVGQEVQLQNKTENNFIFGFYAEYTIKPNSFSNELNSIKDKIDNILPSDTLIELDDFDLLKYEEISEPVGFMGRWFDQEVNGVPCKVTINAGSEFYFKVKNTTSIDLIFETNHNRETPYFAYSIDGSPLVRQHITQPRLPEVSTREHIVRIVVDGLTESEAKWTGEKGIAFSHVEVDDGGSITGVLPNNKIGVFYGDSITEGVRVLSSTESNANGNSASGAYPFITCEKLNAVSYRVGFGASGATKGGSGGVGSLPDVIDNMTATRESPYLVPSFIVINHGTNDGGATSEVFKENYNSALDKLKVKYSGVPIFTMIPFNQRHAENIRSCSENRSYCYVVETAGWGVTFSDGTHPDVNGGLIAGEKLAKEIKKVMGKEYFIV